MKKRKKMGMIARAMSSAAGRRKLAETMAEPLKIRIDYLGIARRVFGRWDDFHTDIGRTEDNSYAKKYFETSVARYLTGKKV